MMKQLLHAAIIFHILVSSALAQSISHISGINIEPNASLDLTYQIVPDYDPVEKVIAGWKGDKLQYFISVDKLPAGWLDPEKYFQGLAQDLRSTGRSVETAKSGNYKAMGSLTGQYLEFLSKSSPLAEPTSQVAHFLTDGKVSFIAFATLNDKTAKNLMLEESKLLFQSSSLSTEKTAQTTLTKAESPYFGTWKWSGTTGNGVSTVSTILMKDDLSFTADVIIENKVVFNATGIWSVSGKRLLWTYIHSEPILPADKREDEDNIVSLDGSRLVLRSKLSGKEREYFKQ